METCCIMKRSVCAQLKNNNNKKNPNLIYQLRQYSLSSEILPDYSVKKKTKKNNHKTHTHTNCLFIDIPFVFLICQSYAGYLFKWDYQIDKLETHDGK